MALTSFAGGRLFGRRLGEGPPRVLALHGWGRTGSDFEPALAGIPAIALDLPGFGASPPPPEAWGGREYASAVAGVLERFDRPPVVVGHSFGGRVALCLAAGDGPAAAAGVGGLVLSGVPLVRLRPAARPSPGYRLARRAHRLGLVPDGWMESLRRRRGSSDYRAAGGVMRDVLVRVVNESYEPELARVEGRVRLVWGGGDREVPLEVAERALTILGGGPARADLRVLDGVGHMVPVEAPDALRAVVEEELGA